MKKYNVHSFFIPVMGTAFTIDTPLKVAKYGISSVISIGDDELCEDMRQHYSQKHGLPYENRILTYPILALSPSCNPAALA